MQETEETSTSRNPGPSSHSSLRKTTSPKVKVGSTVTTYIKGTQQKSPPKNNTTPQPTLVHSKIILSLLPEGAITLSDFPLFYLPGPGHYNIKVSLPQLL